LVLVDDQAVQGILFFLLSFLFFFFFFFELTSPLDKIKEYLFPHLMDGTGLVLQSISEWWDLMREHCDSNKNGKLELKDMEVWLKGLKRDLTNILFVEMQI
jgi:hypothetical protein